MSAVNDAPVLQSIVADLHTHAVGDGLYTSERAPDRVARYLEAAVSAGRHGIGVTDHDDLRPGLLAVEYALTHALPILVIAGMEVSTSDGHLVALGIREPVARWRTMNETIPEIRHQGGVCLLPHPAFAHLRARTDIDAIERLNARYGDFPVERNDLAVVASSDAHVPANLHENPHRTLLRVDRLCWESVVHAIQKRRVSIEDRC